MSLFQKGTYQYIIVDGRRKRVPKTPSPPPAPRKLPKTRNYDRLRQQSSPENEEDQSSIWRPYSGQKFPTKYSFPRVPPTPIKLPRSIAYDQLRQQSSPEDLGLSNSYENEFIFYHHPVSPTVHFQNPRHAQIQAQIQSPPEPISILKTPGKPSILPIPKSFPESSPEERHVKFMKLEEDHAKNRRI
jgi:hypothetical protein